MRKDAKELVADHEPVWNLVIGLNEVGVKREGLVSKRSDHEILKAFAEGKDGGASASQVSYGFPLPLFDVKI